MEIEVVWYGWDVWYDEWCVDGCWYVGDCNW